MNDEHQLENMSAALAQMLGRLDAIERRLGQLETLVNGNGRYRTSELDESTRALMARQDDFADEP